jgi:hypothetical protein
MVRKFFFGFLYFCRSESGLYHDKSLIGGSTLVLGVSGWLGVYPIQKLSCGSPWLSDHLIPSASPELDRKELDRKELDRKIAHPLVKRLMPCKCLANALQSMLTITPFNITKPRMVITIPLASSESNRSKYSHPKIIKTVASTS